MPIWEIFEGCAKGAWLPGATFRNDLGQEIWFDGQSFKGLKEVGLTATWSYVDTKAA